MLSCWTILDHQNCKMPQVVPAALLGDGIGYPGVKAPSSRTESCVCTHYALVTPQLPWRDNSANSRPGSDQKLMTELVRTSYTLLI